MHTHPRRRVSSVLVTVVIAACLVAPTRGASQGPISFSELMALKAPPPTHRVAYGPGPLQFGNLRLPKGEGPYPVVLFVHGGCWLSQYEITHAAPLEQAWADAGYAVWSIEYRRLGDEGGGWPATYDDVADGADYLRTLAAQYPLDLDRVVAAGHSAGGSFALWLAARGHLPRNSTLWSPDPLRVRAVLALAPAPNLADLEKKGVCGSVVDSLMGGSPETFPDRYAAASPMNLVPVGVPQILVVGGKDMSWGPSGRAYYARARDAGDAQVELRIAPESGHFDMIAPTTSSWSVVMKALRDAFAEIDSTSTSPAHAGAGTPSPSGRDPGMLVSADWVAAHEDDPSVVILQAETRKERFTQGHIPGAHFLDMSGLMWDGDPPVGAEMRTPSEIDAALEAAGVSDGQHIVVYGSSALQEARVWATLDIMGLGDRASVLDGGLAGWEQDGRSLSTDTSAGAPGSLTLHPRDGVVVDSDWIDRRLDDPSLTILDARTGEEYAGTENGNGATEHHGHIPGAYSLPWETFVDSRQVPRLHSREELAALVRASGAADGSTVAVYCLTGLRASFEYFVARLLGYDAKLYDGSWRDWGSRDLPYVTGSTRR
jgi:3-mercaptopyruvate sulfurtransferase SseA/acetyl esterase/lipase